MSARRTIRKGAKWGTALVLSAAAGASLYAYSAPHVRDMLNAMPSDPVAHKIERRTGERPIEEHRKEIKKIVTIIRHTPDPVTHVKTERVQQQSYTDPDPAPSTRKYQPTGVYALVSQQLTTAQQKPNVPTQQNTVQQPLENETPPQQVSDSQRPVEQKPTVQPATPSSNSENQKLQEINKLQQEKSKLQQGQINRLKQEVAELEQQQTQDPQTATSDPQTAATSNAPEKVIIVKQKVAKKRSAFGSFLRRVVAPGAVAVGMNLGYRALGDFELKHLTPRWGCTNTYKSSSEENGTPTGAQASNSGETNTSCGWQ